MTQSILPRIHPMRLRIAKPFNDPDYIFELKHDGFRALAYVEEGPCRLVSRNSNLLKSFRTLKASLGKLRVQNAILDGEIICITATPAISRYGFLNWRCRGMWRGSSELWSNLAFQGYRANRMF